jgi:hypothetical protein
MKTLLALTPILAFAPLASAQLNLNARRSIRFVAWTDNEAELRGA